MIRFELLDHFDFFELVRFRVSRCHVIVFGVVVVACSVHVGFVDPGVFMSMIRMVVYIFDTDAEIYLNWVYFSEEFIRVLYL